MNPLPFYFQGSLIGLILGSIAILVAGWFFVRSNHIGLAGLAKKYRYWISIILMALWMASFVNVGHTQNSLHRQSFDSIGKLGVENAEAQTRPTLTPEAARAKAEATARDIRENAQ